MKKRSTCSVNEEDLMTTRQHEPVTATTTTPAVDALSPAAGYALGALRLVVGWTFLWAFFDKLFALGFSTGRDETGAVDRFGDAAWINGGSPTEGFLAFGADGPFEGFYHAIAGATLTNWAFMLGLLAIGVSMSLGVFRRLGTLGGVVMYLMMWTVALPPENNPIIDDHVLGAAAVLVLGVLGAGRYLGLGCWWERQAIVQQYRILR
jgi:thiosulfate dehydrogenase [quinone] large subunit